MSTFSRVSQMHISDWISLWVTLQPKALDLSHSSPSLFIHTGFTSCTATPAFTYHFFNTMIVHMCKICISGPFVRFLPLTSVTHNLVYISLHRSGPISKTKVGELLFEYFCFHATSSF